MGTYRELLADIFAGMDTEDILQKHGMSAADFETAKSEMLDQMRGNPAKGGRTIAAELFYRLAKERKRSKWLSDNGVSDPTIHQCLERVANGKFAPSHSVIMPLRHAVRPAAWFFTEKEGLPPPVLKPGLAPFRNTPEESLARLERATCGQAFLNTLRKYRLMKAFCAEHGLVYTSVSHFLSMENRNGKWVYSANPPSALVSKLKNLVCPDYWYAFPDEVLPEAEKALHETARSIVGDFLRIPDCWLRL